jgi:hypothetical protein
MITFLYAVDERCREPKKPEVAELKFPDETVYIIIGTEYGYLHTTFGTAMTFKHKSSATRYMKRKYYELTKPPVL